MIHVIFQWNCINKKMEYPDPSRPIYLFYKIISQLKGMRNKNYKLRKTRRRICQREKKY